MMSLQNCLHGPQELCGRCSRDQRLQILAAQNKRLSTAPQRLPWAGLGCAGSGCADLGPGWVALDTCQGFGCDMVLLCTVRGDQTGIIGFMAVPGRFNVAMRRGKRVLTVFGKESSHGFWHLEAFLQALQGPGLDHMIAD